MPLRYIHLDPGNAGGSIVNPQMETYEDILPHLSECPWCQTKFSKKDQLNKHINDNHDLECPALYQGDFRIPTDTDFNIVNLNDLEMLRAYMYQEIKLSVNHQNRPHCRGLVDIVSEIINNELFAHRCELILCSEHHQEQKFNLIIKIADPDQLIKIDERFNDMLCKKELSMEDVNTFADECRQFIRCIDYYDGLCEYIHGYLIKQQFENITIPRHIYQKKFTAALEKIKGYEAIYGPIVTDFINFNLNDFKISEDRVFLIPGLDAAIYFFKLREEGNSIACEDTPFDDGKDNKQFPIDEMTDFILDCLTDYNLSGKKILDKEKIEKLKVFEKSPHTVMADIVKCRVLLAEVSQGNEEKKNYLSKLLDSSFKEWASDELEKIN